MASTESGFRLSSNRLLALRALRSGGGVVADESGRATDKLGGQIRPPLRAQSLSKALTGLERAGLVSREIEGRRCYSIALTDRGARLLEERNPADRTSGTGSEAHGLETLAGDAGPASAIEQIKSWALGLDPGKPLAQVRLEFESLCEAGPVDGKLDLAYVAALNASAQAILRRLGEDHDLTIAEVDGLLLVLGDIASQLRSHRRRLERST